MYLFGLLLLLLVAVSTAVAGRLLMAPQPTADMPDRLARYLDVELAPILDQPDALQQKLERVHEAFAVDLAIYDAGHEAIAAVGDPPPGPVEGEAPDRPMTMRKRSRDRWLEHRHVVPFDDGRAYMVATYRWQTAGSRWLLMPVVVLLVLALASLPLARTIVRPLEKVTQTARALGEGDLSARTGVNRADEVGSLARAFDDMAQRLQTLVDNEKELLANVSHELRTPIARIRVALELAEDDDPDAARTRLQGISQDLAELEQLVEQVLMASRLDRTAELPINRRSVLFDQLAERVGERLADLHPDHRLEVQTSVERLYADPALLRRLLDNLVDNAAKYSDSEAGPVELVVDDDADGTFIEVRDRGIGVSEEDLPHLFEPFFRTDKSRQRGTGGVGLGLALCRRIVEAHGGNIEAERREGGGLIVRIYLPPPPSGSSSGKIESPASPS